jgi:hypothetical protein
MAGAPALTGARRRAVGPVCLEIAQLGRRLVTYRGARDSLGPRHTLGPSDRLRLPAMKRPVKFKDDVEIKMASFFIFHSYRLGSDREARNVDD